MNKIYKDFLEQILIGFFVVILTIIFVIILLSLIYKVSQTETVCINNIIYEKNGNYYSPLYWGGEKQYCINKASS